MAENMKKWYERRSVWGLVIAGAAGVVNAFWGGTITEAEQTAITDWVIQGVGFLGIILAAIGIKR